MFVWNSRLQMSGLRLCLVAACAQVLFAAAAAVKAPHHRRSTVQGNLPSKGGWRPVVGSSGIYYGALGTAPLHAQYKIPLDIYQSSVRPIATRDVGKLTSIAQSYRPTTLRTISTQSSPHPGQQPINSYLNPFALPNNGFTHYKLVPNYQPQNYQSAENVLIRNPHNPYAARPVQQHISKKPAQYHNNILQQLTNVQQLQFGQYPTGKPLDLFAAPINYQRPVMEQEKRPNSAETEIFKPEVYKVSETESSPHFVSQQVKTAQQQNIAGVQRLPQNPYAQYTFQDLANFHQFPPSILGSFDSFRLQSLKGRDPLHPVTKAFLPAQSPKHTTFNSFGYTPTYKSTPALFSTTTPRLQTVPNHLLFDSSYSNLGSQQTKLELPLKIDPNAGIKNSFKATPQDHLVKNAYNLGINKITTYNPPLVQSTTPFYYSDYGAQLQNGLLQTYNNQQNANYNNYNNQKPLDSVGLTQQVSQQYVDAPETLNIQNNENSKLYRPSYEVVENETDDTNAKTQSPWTATSVPFINQNLKQEIENNIYDKPTTPVSEQPDEYSIVTEGEKDFDNGFNYNQYDSQSRRPLGDDFEPIGKQKLNDYYYRVSTPAYNNKTFRRTKKPTETVKQIQEVTTEASTNGEIVDASSPLPTLPPNLHFKRPSSNETQDKDKVRKRNKIRRRRPQFANVNHSKSENSTQIEPSTEAPTTISDEIHTIRPRLRTTKASVTTQIVTTDYTTSALPTTAPTRPTLMKKKLIGHRRPFTTTTTTEKYETSTQPTREHKFSRESPIMKISTRPQQHKSTISHEAKNNETPDYSHKQDEKDTPTSDVSVSLTDTLKTSSDIKEFSFHRDMRPVEMKETTESPKELNDDTSQREETSATSKLQRPRLKNKFNRPKFSMKDYRSRLNSTTSTTETPTENTPRARIPQRKQPNSDNYFTEVETTTERKKFTPKEPRHKFNKTDNNEQEIHSRHANRSSNKQTEETEGPPQKISSRIRSGQRRPKPTEDTTETTSATISKRPLRKKVYDSEGGESVNDVSVTDTTPYDRKPDLTSERSRSESAIMKIADKKHNEHAERVSEHSKRVSDLTLAASKDYNTPGMFKTVSSNSRRIPSYFTIATDDPILPIEAFFPQLNQKKDT